MEEGPSWASDRSSASQEIPRILWNQKVCYLIYDPATCPYPEPDRSSLFPSNSLL